MKKLITIVLSILSLATFGQPNHFNVGIEGGLSLASLRGNEVITQFHKSRMGYSSGVSVQYNLNKLYSLRSGIHYERKGSSIDGEVTNENGEAIGTFHAKENFDYLTFPFLFRLSFGNKIKYFVNAGPYLGILLKQTVTAQEFPEYKSDETDYFKSTELGIAGGTGLEFDLKRFFLSVEVRDNLGLNNISALPILDGGSIKTNALYLLFGVAYKIGKRKEEEKK